MAEGDILWGRPELSGELEGPYSGPPAGEPAAPDWRPERHESAPLPRRLPVIDDDAVDAAEREAAHLTYTTGVFALVSLLVLICWRIL